MATRPTATTWDWLTRFLTTGKPIWLRWDGGDYRGHLRKIRLNADGSLFVEFTTGTTVEVPSAKGGW